MFKKLVSNLAFSPSVIEDIGRYGNWLKKEESTRKLTVFFIVLTLLVQTFTLFSPPYSANASNSQDIVPGGLSNQDDLLSMYDRNDQDLKDIFRSIGITRNDLETLRPSKIEKSKNTYTLSRYGGLNASNYEVPFAYDRSVGGSGIRYFTQLNDAKMVTRSMDGWIGSSTSLGWFAITKASGSILVKKLPVRIKNNNLSEKNLDKKLIARRLNPDTTFENVRVKNNERIEYELSVTNNDTESITGSFDVHLDDALEYASLIERGGAEFSKDTKRLSWQQVTIKPMETQSRTFVLKMSPQFPSTPQGKSNPNSYDCMITVVFGQKISIPIDCPPEKNLEWFLMLLPETNRSIPAFATLLIFSLVVYMYVRAKILSDELRILRHRFSKGVI